MKSKQIRQITDGAIVVALYGLIFLISRFAGGQLEYSISFLMPLPLAVYAFKYDFKKALVPFAAGIVLSFLLSINPLNALVFNVPYLFIGALLGGILIKRGIKPIYSILIVAFVVAITEVLGTVILSQFLGIENIFSDIKITIQELETIFRVNSGDFALIQALMEGMIPSIIMVLSLLNSLTTYLVFVLLAGRIFKCQFNSEVLKIFSLNNMIPKWISVAYIFILLSAGVSLFLFNGSEGFLRILYVILINAAIIGGTIYLYFGLRVTGLYIRYLNKKWLLVIVFIFLIIPSPIFVIIGLLDNFLSLQLKIYNKIAKRS